eukprot:11168110-Lingulodinium_polyedra.AAC.1
MYVQSTNQPINQPIIPYVIPFPFSNEARICTGHGRVGLLWHLSQSRCSTGVCQLADAARAKSPAYYVLLLALMSNTSQ